MSEIAMHTVCVFGACRLNKGMNILGQRDWTVKNAKSDPESQMVLKKHLSSVRVASTDIGYQVSIVQNSVMFCKFP